MIYFYYGAETYLMRRKLNHEIGRYRAKYRGGMNFARFDFEQNNFAEFKIFMDACSIFAEKKLAVLENPFGAAEETQQKLFEYLQDSKLSKNDVKFLIIFQVLEPSEGKTKEKYQIKNNFSKQFFKKLISSSLAEGQEFDFLTPTKVESWIRKAVQESDGQIMPGAAKKLAIMAGNDLWRLNNEISKLVSFKSGKIIDEEAVENLVKGKIESDIFKTIDALAARNQAAVYSNLRKNLEQGEAEIALLGMLIYQFRNLLLVKNLVEQGIQFSNLQSKLKLHPFVLRKTFEQSKNFSLPVLKKIFARFLELDLNIKNGLIEPLTALDLVVKEIAS